MPLQQIAHQIITLADRRASTPVLVTPPYLSFRQQFFVELSLEISTHTDRRIRIDWYRGLPSLRTIISDQMAAWHVKSVNRMLKKRPPIQADAESGLALDLNAGSKEIHPSYSGSSDARHAETKTGAKVGPNAIATVQITASIARPGGKNRDLVIGLSDARQKLPNWTTAIWLGTSQAEIKAWNAA